MVYYMFYCLLLSWEGEKMTRAGRNGRTRSVAIAVAAVLYGIRQDNI